MMVRARLVEDEHGLYVTCGNCGNRLATLLSGGRTVDEPVPYACPLCDAVVDKGEGKAERPAPGRQPAVATEPEEKPKRRRKSSSSSTIRKT